MPLYLAVTRQAFRRHSTYRTATVAALVEQTVVSTLRAYVWLAVVGARGEIGGLDRAEIVTFAFAAGAIQSAFMVTWETEIVERIRSGDVVTDLYRPVDFQLWWLTNELGRCGFSLLTRAVPAFVIGSLVFDLRLPVTLGGWAGVAVVGATTFLVVYAWRYLLSLAGFWLVNPFGVLQLGAFVFTVASGSLVPLSFMPDAVGDALQWLPWAAMLQLPAEVLVGQSHAAPVVAVQVAWAAMLLGIGRVVMDRARRRLVVQGG